MKKRILSILLSIIIVFAGIFPKMSITAQAEQVYVGDFNLYEYRANVYLKNDTICNRTIQNMMTTTLPAQRIVEQLDCKKSFQNSVGVWKLAHYATSPSDIAQGGIDEQGYYTAIILSVFKAETSNDTYIFDCVKSINSETNKMLSNMKKWVKETDQIEVDSISKNQIITTISIDDQKAIKEYLSGEFKKNHPVLNTSSTITSDLDSIFNSVKTLGEAIELMESYIQISEMSYSMKQVLNQMYMQCPDNNKAMKAALHEAALSSESLYGALSATISNTAGKGVADVVGVLLDEGWEKIIQSNTYAKAFMKGAEVGTWLGDTVCNTLFSTDKTIEQYEKMKCLSEFTILLKDTVTYMGNVYLTNKSTQNADNYFAAVDALYSAGYLSCDFAKDYGKILYEDAALGWIGISKVDYEQYINSVQSIKKIYEDQENSLKNSYLAELEYDYPEIYEILMGTDESEQVAVTGISFDYEEITIGLKDTYIVGIKKPNVLPSNATNQKVTYTSSDVTILGVDPEGGWCSARAEGTVVVTATSEDGNYTDTIKVNVVAGTSATWDAISGPKVVDYGECGEDAEWVMYDDGTMIIEGEGEIKGKYKWKSLSIKSVKILDGITSIGEYAFSGCSGLTSIEIPSGVTSIGEYAFKDCSGLTSMELPAGVTSIGDGAFECCSGLTSIEIPTGVTSIGYDAFRGCDNLVIFGTVNSYAKNYADENGIEFVVIDEDHIHSYETITTKASTEEKTNGFICKRCAECGFEADKKTINYYANNIILPQNQFIYDGSAKEPEVTVKDCEGNTIDKSNYTVAYSNNINAGTATVTVTMKGNYEGTLSKTFTIGKVEAKTVTLSEEIYTYDGTEKKPTVKVKDSTGKVIPSSNYTVTYSNNTNSGKATVKVTMKEGSNYKGTHTKTFTINKATNKITATSSYTKNASSKTQSFLLNAKATGGKLTYKSISKSVSVNSVGKVIIAKNFAGKATVTITAGDANYKTVAKTVRITVKPAKTKVISAKNSSSRKAIIMWSKLSYVSGYQIQYGIKSSFQGAKTITVNGGSKVSKVITGLAKGKTYYVRIRTYKTVGNTKYYSIWSAKKGVRISK